MNDPQRAAEIFNRGYNDALAGKRLPEGASNDYHDGWDAGNCDRPMMDDVVDAEKERTDPFGC